MCVADTIHIFVLGDDDADNDSIITITPRYTTTIYHHDTLARFVGRVKEAGPACKRRSIGATICQVEEEMPTVRHLVCGGLPITWQPRNKCIDHEP